MFKVSLRHHPEIVNYVGKPVSSMLISEASLSEDNRHLLVSVSQLVVVILDAMTLQIKFINLIPMDEGLTTYRNFNFINPTAALCIDQERRLRLWNLEKTLEATLQIGDGCPLVDESTLGFSKLTLHLSPQRQTLTTAKKQQLINQMKMSQRFASAQSKVSLSSEVEAVDESALPAFKKSKPATAAGDSSSQRYSDLYDEEELEKFYSDRHKFQKAYPTAKLLSYIFLVDHSKKITMVGLDGLFYLAPDNTEAKPAYTGHLLTSERLAQVIREQAPKHMLSNRAREGSPPLSNRTATTSTPRHTVRNIPSLTLKGPLKEVADLQIVDYIGQTYLFVFQTNLEMIVLSLSALEDLFIQSKSYVKNNTYFLNLTQTELLPCHGRRGEPRSELHLQVESPLPTLVSVPLHVHCRDGEETVQNGLVREREAHCTVQCRSSTSDGEV